MPENRVALVLGTSSRVGNRPNIYFVSRMEAVIDLYRDKKVSRILVSGDNSNKYYNEPQEMYQYLVDKGIPKNHIYKDFAGFRTLDSVVRAKDIFQLKKFTIVSNGFHLHRAIYLARYNGLDAVGFSTRKIKVFGHFKIKWRERFARVKAIYDLVFDIKPRFSGDKVIIK